MRSLTDHRDIEGLGEGLALGGGAGDGDASRTAAVRRKARFNGAHRRVSEATDRDKRNATVRKTISPIDGHDISAPCCMSTARARQHTSLRAH